MAPVNFIDKKIKCFESKNQVNFLANLSFSVLISFLCNDFLEIYYIKTSSL